MSQTPNISPPKFALKLLKWFLRGDLLEEVLGDLEEKFELEMETYSLSKAKRNYWYQVIQYIRPFAFKRSILKHSNWTIMFNHYLKVSWRNVLRSRGFSLINIFGLAFGLTASVLIMMYVADEWSYDKHHKDGDQIYRIVSHGDSDKWVAVPAPVAEAVKDNFPEVETVSRIIRIPGFETILLKNQPANKQFFESNVFYVDSTFFDVFTYDFVYGTADGLAKPNTIAISDEVALRFFGQENPVGKPLTVGLSFGDFTYTVGAVFDKDRYKSHIPANILLSMDNNDIGTWVKSQRSWIYNSLFISYVKLTPSTDPDAFEVKVQELYEREAGEDLREAGFSKTLYLQPMKDIYLHSDYKFEIAPNGNFQYLLIFISIALFLVVIACINFMNLSTARSEQRAKEVGLRKVVGAYKTSLVHQFLLESILMSVLSLVVCVILLQLITPFFNDVISRDLSIWEMPSVGLMLVGLALLSGLLAGLYPSFYLSSFRPAAVLKGSLKNSFSATAIRKGLVVFQFTISSVLILGALLIGQQMQYMSNQNLGFDSEHKLVVPLKTNEAVANVEALSNQLKQRSDVKSISVAGAYPGSESITDMLFFAEGKTSQDNVDVQTTFVDDHYVETLGIKLLKGRSFSKDHKSDTSGVVLNEAAINLLGYELETAVGRPVYYGLNGERNEMRIIGVVEDYHYQSLQHKIEPMALLINPFFSGPTRFMVMNVQSSNYQHLLTSLESDWQSINSESPFMYHFLDAEFERSYHKEVLTLKLIQSFTVIAIVIACLGLFGLTAFTVERKTKEIGIRKVLGANVWQVVMLLSRDFAKLVMLAIVLAAPIAYFLMDEWLSGFAYRISISVWVFLISGVIAILLALLTVSFQATRAALINPVKSLRSE